MFWFDKKQLRYNLGTFDIKEFDTKKLSDKLYKIVNDHTNDKGLWIKNPKITAKHKRERIKKAELQKRQMLTIR